MKYIGNAVNVGIQDYNNKNNNMKILIDKEKLETRIAELGKSIMNLPQSQLDKDNYIKYYKWTSEKSALQSILQQGEEYKGSVDEEGFGITRVIYDKKEDSKVTRLEVIDHSPQGKGRAYSKHDIKSFELSYQDDGKTLKIFIK